MEAEVKTTGQRTLGRGPNSFVSDLARRVRVISPVGLILCFTLLALVLRVLRLEFQPLWWDEGYSVWFATHSLGEMVSLTAEDIHPPLYYALLHLWTLVAGRGPVSVRLVSVLAGVAAIPLIYVAAKGIFGSRRVALLAAFVLAISPLSIYYSQEVRMYGLVALLSTGVLWAAWGAIEAGTTPRSAFLKPATAYVVLATLALYTQYYAVLLPIGLTVYALWRFRHSGKSLLRWVGLQVIVALLYLPWVIYAAPRLTLYISQKVVKDADKPLGLIAYFARHLSAFAAGHLEGVLARGWPLALVLLAPVVVGLILVMRDHGKAGNSADVGSRPDIYVRATEQRPKNGADGSEQREGVLFLGTVLLVALFLGWLIGLRFPFFPERGERLLLLALPAFIMLAAAGLVALVGSRTVAARWSAYTATGLFVIISAASLVAFYTVPRYPDDDYRPLIARSVVQGAPSDTVFAIYPWQVGYWRSYAAASDGPTAILTPGVEWGDKIRNALDDALQRGHVWFPAHLALGGILETQVEQYLASGAIPFANTWYGPGTRLSAWQALQQPGAQGPAAAATNPLATYTLADGSELALRSVSTAASTVPAANAVVPVSLAWQGAVQPDLAVSVRLVDDLGQIWAQNDYEPLGAMVGSSGREENDRKWHAVDDFGLLVPAGTPPGRYRAELVVLHAGDGQPLTGEVPGQGSTTSVPLFEIQVAPADDPLTPDRLPVAARQSIDIQDGLRFLGYTLDEGPLAPGELRRANLFWQATGQPSSDYTAFVQLLGKDGSPVAAWETPPGAANPTSQWMPNTLIRTQAFFRPNAEMADGSYPLIAGLYRTNDGTRLKTTSGEDSLSLGSVTIKSRPRQTAKPQPQVPADTTFGSFAHLVGYDASVDGQTPGVTLYWEALGASDHPYSVFVHLLDTEGKVAGYGDSEPGNGAYPTTGWRKGEYLTDKHTIQTPAASRNSGLRQAAVGFYDPSTGKRLLTENGEDQVILTLGQ